MWMNPIMQFLIMSYESGLYRLPAILSHWRIELISREKVYMRSRQTDRERHQPVDVTKQYVRSITFSERETAVPKKCPQCGRSFEEPDYEYCPFDGTALTEPTVSVQN